MVDLDPQGMDPRGDAVSIETAVTHHDAEDQIALRGGIRFKARLRRAAARNRGQVQLAPDGAYLITGGLGVLGMIVAGWLVDRGARNLVLVGRKPLPARSEWRNLPTDHDQFSVIQGIRSIEANGGHVEVISMDVQDSHALRRYKDYRDREERPPIRGIVHAAGVLQNSQVANANQADVQAIFGPKIRGSRNLWRVFGSDSLDFVVFFSSLASVLPVVGQGVYGAANAFLDAFATHLQGLDVPSISIDWGPWNAGMMTQPGLTDFHASRGMFPLEPAVCIDVMDRLVSDPRPQRIVAAADWATVRRTYPVVPPILKDLDINSGSGKGTEQDLETVSFAERFEDTAAEERESLVLAELSQLIASVFRMPAERLIPDQSLTAYGLDSMMATEIKNRLEVRLGMKISAVDLLKGITPSKLMIQAISQLEEKRESLLPSDFLEASEAQLEQALLEVEMMTDAELKGAL
jgi:NADP-dependent 3-hydroxy acid dehydrogenase YdfG/acyl carrier protein